MLTERELGCEARHGKEEVGKISPKSKAPGGHCVKGTRHTLL